ncbi:hypothetical protein EYR36_006883 [Pleurotus pulmonarius]|nr:hypothetical protein EYR36_006883 [Pleurotus pulmonarius]KAF4580315.1 hypothetical protein EYR38_003206 [Pleurotus pulmonarius]
MAVDLGYDELERKYTWRLAHVYAAVHSIVYAPAPSRPSTAQFVGASGWLGIVTPQSRRTGSAKTFAEDLGHLHPRGGPHPQRPTRTPPTSRLSLDRPSCLSSEFVLAPASFGLSLELSIALSLSADASTPRVKAGTPHSLARPTHAVASAAPKMERKSSRRYGGRNERLRSAQRYGVAFVRDVGGKGLADAKLPRSIQGRGDSWVMLPVLDPDYPDHYHDRVLLKSSS